MNNKGRNSLLAGSFIASLFASACCIGPILFAVLGISSAGLLSKFEPYRGILTAIALLMLILGFIFTFRKKALSECKEKSICANPKSDTWNKTVMVLAAILVILLLTFPQWSLIFIEA